MIVHNIEIVTIFVILFFGIPILWNARKNGVLKPFSFINLIKTINKSLKIQGIIGLILMLLSWIFNSSGFKFERLIAETMYTYLTIGIFIYLPVLGILNLVRSIMKRKNKKQESE